MPSRAMNLQSFPDANKLEAIYQTFEAFDMFHLIHSIK